MFVIGKGDNGRLIGMLLEKKGLHIAMLKLDPYLNVDPGTMNPFQHGEVYVTDDGAETDLDLGHYYRYTNSPLSQASNATSGQIYNTVIKGKSVAATISVIRYKSFLILQTRSKSGSLMLRSRPENIDVVLVEIGGTVGDIESLPFLEAIRQFRYEQDATASMST